MSKGIHEIDSFFKSELSSNYEKTDWKDVLIGAVAIAFLGAVIYFILLIA